MLFNVNVVLPFALNVWKKTILLALVNNLKHGRKRKRANQIT